MELGHGTYGLVDAKECLCVILCVFAISQDDRDEASSSFQSSLQSSEMRRRMGILRDVMQARS